MSGDSCPSCGSAAHRGIYEQDGVPAHSCLLMSTREEARQFPRGSIRLRFCESCGFIFNAAFDPALESYSQRYEETQAYSPRFRRFARELAAGLVDKHDLHHKLILEIGCGKGDFLVDLCELGDNHGIGFDPAFVPSRVSSPAAERITFIEEFYDERHTHLSADFVACRHTLEHIPDTGRFMRAIRDSFRDRPGAVIFFELPDMLRILREAAFWDIYYEHCSYFTAGSLARLYRRAGLEVSDLELVYDGQYILIEGHATGDGGPPFPAEETVEELAREVEGFRQALGARLEQWAELLEGVRERGETAVLWGSGSKAVSFLTTLGLDEQVRCVVDINPHKHGHFMAGTGHEIVAPEHLREVRPDVVVAMNPIYRDEIQGLLDDLGVGCRLLAV